MIFYTNFLGLLSSSTVVKTTVQALEYANATTGGLSSCICWAVLDLPLSWFISQRVKMSLPQAVNCFSSKTGVQTAEEPPNKPSELPGFRPCGWFHPTPGNPVVNPNRDVFRVDPWTKKFISIENQNTPEMSLNEIRKVDYIGIHFA